MALTNDLKSSSAVGEEADEEMCEVWSFEDEAVELEDAAAFDVGDEGVEEANVE